MSLDERPLKPHRRLHASGLMWNICACVWVSPCFWTAHISKASLQRGDCEVKVVICASRVLFEGNYCFERRKTICPPEVRWGVCVSACQECCCCLTLVLCVIADVDECQWDADVCPPRWRCKNTFGSFVCVCQDGFVMGTLQDSVQCRGKKMYLAVFGIERISHVYMQHCDFNIKHILQPPPHCNQADGHMFLIKSCGDGIWV